MGEVNGQTERKETEQINSNVQTSSWARSHQISYYIQPLERKEIWKNKNNLQVSFLESWQPTQDNIYNMGAEEGLICACVQT